ncbi:MAG: class I SAM-dependent methyltransferase [Halobacteriales archaeon]
MGHPLDAAVADPWAALRLVIGEPLHPGGTEATEALLDRADVGPDTWLLDVGCGAGGPVSVAYERGARAVGLDRQPSGSAMLQGDLETLPIATGGFDVVLAECVLCLAEDPGRAMEEAARVLGPDGRLALSDVVLEGPLPDLPRPIERVLCLNGPRSREDLQDRLHAAGFEVGPVSDHREALLELRDRAGSRVDYERLLPAFGDRGRRLLDGVHQLEAAVEAGDVSYVSLVARAPG